MRRALVTKASTLVELDFYFPMVGGSRELGLGAESPCHQGFNPGEILPRVGGSRELGLGAKSPGHQGFNLGEIKILFSKGGLPRDLSLRAKSPCHPIFSPGEI